MLLLAVLVCVPVVPAMLILFRGSDWMQQCWKDEHYRGLLIYVMLVFGVLLWLFFQLIALCF